MIVQKVVKHNFERKVAKAERKTISSYVPSNAWLNEDGTPLLNEDGSFLLVE